MNHIGWGNGSTNCCAKNWEYNGVLRNAPMLPNTWPVPAVNPMCHLLDCKMYTRPWSDVFPRVVPAVRKALRLLGVKV